MGSLQVALKQVQQYRKQVYVVFAILELLDDFTDQDDYKLRDSVKIIFADMLVHVNLAVKGIEADIYQAFYL